MTLGNNYIIHWDDGDVSQDIVAIEIKTGTFSGVVYRYQTVGFTDTSPPTLAFKYIVLENPTEESLEDDNVDFITVIGDILQELILSTMDDMENNGTERN